MQTVVIYHIDDEETPYRTKLAVPPGEPITLADFKSSLNLPKTYKYFFKSEDDDFGIVKEEISDDRATLPLLNHRVEAWLVSADGSAHSDPSTAVVPQNSGHVDQRVSPRHKGGHHGGSVRGPGTGDSRPPSFHGRRNEVADQFDQSACTSETESTISGLPKFPRHGTRLDRRSFRPQYYDRSRMPHHRNRSVPAEGSSAVTSDLETTSFVDSEDEQASRVSTSTDITSVSRQHLKTRKPKRRRPRQIMSRASSVSSITESSMSLNIITVTLNMEAGNFLGISIVGHSNQLGGDGGIYVGSIMKGGAVALDGRIEPGDMILEVNDVSFENLSNDDAVRVLRESVQKPEPIKLVVAKCWDPNPKNYFTLPRTEPIRPIDPGAWVAHTNALCGDAPDYSRPASVSTVVSNNSGSFTSSLPDSDKYFQDLKLDLKVHDIQTIVRAMARPDSGLEVKNRIWLKINIPNAFLGSDLVDWLFNHVQGFVDRKEARKYANRLLKEGYIRHTVNKITFSDQCYYVFGDLCGNFCGMRLDAPHEESVGQSEHDTGISSGVSPLLPPPPMTPSAWPSIGSALPTYPAPPYAPSASMASGYAPMPFQYLSEQASTLQQQQQHPMHVYPSLNSFSVSVNQASGGSGSAPTARSEVNSLSSGGSGGSSGSDGRKPKVLGPSPLCKDVKIQETGVATSLVDGQEGSRGLEEVPRDLASSRQSFRMAMGNPCEFFVDVM